MQFTIQTVYEQKDIVGFYEAFLAGKQGVRTSKKILKGITTILAIPCWLLAAVMFLAQLPTGNLQLILTGIPMSMALALLGFWLYSCGKPRFAYKASWKAYPHKGETLTFHFDERSFTLTQKDSVTETQYTGIVRLCEDRERFYLFISPQNAHILPKRDFQDGCTDRFRDFIEKTTGVSMVEL